MVRCFHLRALPPSLERGVPMTYYQDTPPAGRWTLPGDEALRSELDLLLRHHVLHVYTYMAGGLWLSGLAAYLMAYSGFHAAIVNEPLLMPFIWLMLIAAVGLFALICFSVERMNFCAAQVSFWAYAALLGFSLGCIFLVHTETSLAPSFFVAGGTFAVTSLYGYATGTELSHRWAYLLMGLVGLLLAATASYFEAWNALQFVVSLVGVVISVGLAARYAERIRGIYLDNYAAGATGTEAVLGALTLYLNANPAVPLLEREAAQRD